MAAFMSPLPPRVGQCQPSGDRGKVAPTPGMGPPKGSDQGFQQQDWSQVALTLYMLFIMVMVQKIPAESR